MARGGGNPRRRGRGQAEPSAAPGERQVVHRWRDYQTASGRRPIKEFLAERVPKWWIPNDLEIIEEVPKTSVGKFSKKTLREQFAERKTTA